MYLWKKLCPSVTPSACRSICMSRTMAVFEGKKSSYDIIITLSDDEVIASDVPSQYLFMIIHHKELKEILFFKS